MQIRSQATTSNNNPSPADSKLDQTLISAQLPKADVVMAILGFYLKMKGIQPECETNDIPAAILHNIKDIVILMHAVSKVKTVQAWQDFMSTVFDLMLTELAAIRKKDDAAFGIGGWTRKISATWNDTDINLYYKTLIAVLSYCSNTLLFPNRKLLEGDPIFELNNYIKVELSKVDNLEKDIIQAMVRNESLTTVKKIIQNRADILFQLMKLGNIEATVRARHFICVPEIDSLQPLIHEHESLAMVSKHKYIPEFNMPRYHEHYFQTIILHRDTDNFGERTFADFEENASTRRKAIIPKLKGMALLTQTSDPSKPTSENSSKNGQESSQSSVSTNPTSAFGSNAQTQLDNTGQNNSQSTDGNSNPNIPPSSSLSSSKIPEPPLSENKNSKTSAGNSAPGSEHSTESHEANQNSLDSGASRSSTSSPKVLSTSAEDLTEIEEEDVPKAPTKPTTKKDTADIMKIMGSQTGDAKDTTKKRPTQPSIGNPSQQPPKTSSKTQSSSNNPKTAPIKELTHSSLRFN